jgi:hypothetical protein
MAEPALPPQQHPTVPLPPLHKQGRLHYLGITSLDRQDKHLWYVVSVGSILNQSRLSSQGHHHLDSLVVEFFFRATRTPVHVSAML